MSIPMPAAAVLDRYFLEMRCKVLDVAAALDRIEQATHAQPAMRDSRLVKLRQAISVLLDEQSDRATRVQMIFSDPYEPKWERPTTRSA